MSTSNEVEAMRLALEALEDISQMQNHSNSGDSSDVDKAIKALEQALAQSRSDVKQEQRSVSEHTGEPVAWLCQKDNGHFDVLTDQTCKKCFPVYTTPYVPEGRQQRKPLTDEQIELLADSLEVWDYDSEKWVLDSHTFARAIEAAHGIRPSDFKE